MPKIPFLWPNSKKSDTLAIDAAPLDENNDDRNSSDTLQSNSLSISPLSPEMGISPSLDNMSLTRTNDLMGESSSALAINNAQTNFYQFSYVNGLHIGTSVQITNNAEPSTSRRSSPSDIRKTTTIDMMMKSTEPVNERVMDVISTHLGENWRFVFRTLGYSDGQIDQMYEDHHRGNGVKEVIYRLLLDYSRNNDDASLGHITRIMWKNGFKECVHILKVHWKKGDLTGSCSKEKSDDSS